MSDDSRQRGHDAWTGRLSEHLDGLLPGHEAEALEEHLEACAACRGVLDDLRAVRDAARAMEDTPPGRDLWPGIREAIAPGAAAVPAAPSGPAVGRGGRSGFSRGGRGFFLTVPQLAAAAVAFLLLGGAGGWAVGLVGGSAGSPVPATTALAPEAPADGEAASVQVSAGDEIASSYAPEVRRLEELLASSRERLDPSTIRVLEKNLQLIDGAIRESVAALEVDPGNAWVRDHLRRSWERKVTYLRETADLLGWSEAD